jgi:hypothetical protein
MLKLEDELPRHAFEDFDSPFPSREAQESVKYQKLLDEGSGPGKMAASQAVAWREALQMSLARIVTSPIAGGIRADWWSQLNWDTGETGELTGQPIIDGVFAPIGFSSSVKSGAYKSLKKEGEAIGEDLMGDLGQRGFNKALDVITSNTGVYGKIVGAAVKVGQFFFSLAFKNQDIQLMTVPWTEYSKWVENDVINDHVVPMMEGVDWTKMFAPALDPLDFQIAESTEGENTRVYGPFEEVGRRPGSEEREIAGTPRYGNGFGFMPGTQRMADVMQVAQVRTGGDLGMLGRVDAITNVGDFFPSTAQFATVAEQLIMKAGSADMYKIRPGYLSDLWQEYWGAFFADGFAQIKHFRTKGASRKNVISSLFTAKALAPWIHWRDKNGSTGLGFAADRLARANNWDAFINDRMFKPGGGFPGSSKTYSDPFEPLIKPALDRIRTAQKNALARTVACAFVRYEDVGDLPAFAAFDNSAHGREIAKLCHDVREILLKNNLRYTIRTKDVMVIDPVFGRRLRDSKERIPPLGIKGTDRPLISAIPAVPKGELPKGGAPFDIMPAVSGRKGGAGVALAAAVGIVALAAGRR